MSALTLGLIAAFAWGFHDICVRALSQRTPLMAALMTVVVVGLLFHLGLMAWTDAFAPIPMEATVSSVIAGLFYLTASVGLYGAFQRGPVRLVAPIIAAYPIVSVAWAAVSGVPVAWAEWLAVLAVVAGVSLVAALADDGDDTVPPRGRTILYAAISALGFAGAFAFGQHAAAIAGEMGPTFVTRLTAVVVLAVGMAALRLPFWPGMRAVPVLILMGLADGIALVAILSAGGMADAQFAAVAASVFGLLTILMAWAFLGERMTLPQWLGCAVTFGAIGYLAL